MEKVQVNHILYTQFLIASEGNVTATRAEDIFSDPGLHDRITRWLANSQLTPGQLWHQVKGLVDSKKGWLLLDDSVLDKPFGPTIGLSHWQYSGTHHKVVHGIGLMTLVWTDGELVVPVNYRIYDKTTDGKTKHQHARELLIWAKGQDFAPASVLFDTWYSAVKTLRLIRSFNWHFCCELRANRLVGSQAKDKLKTHLFDIDFSQGKPSWVYLKGVGLIQVAKTVDQQNGRVRYVATSDPATADVQKVYARRWQIEVYHREIKQTTAIANCQARRSRSQRNHIFCSLAAYCAFQINKLKTKFNSYQTKLKIFLPALRSYLTSPTVPLPLS